MTRPSIIAAGVAVAVAVALSGCGSGSEPTAVPSATAASQAATSSSAVKTGARRRPDSDGNGIPDVITVKGKLGDTLALQGSGLNDDPKDHTKTRVRITLKRLVGPFSGFDIPQSRQLIGIQLRFVNTGKLVYDNPQPHGELTVAGGETGKQTSLIAIGRKSPCDNPSVKLQSGQAKNVCIAFEVPKAEKPMSFQYVADSGYGDTGLWALG
jgi:hypothetical protein